MTTLGEKLTELRDRKGWTKTFVAKKLGIKTLSTYANYEYGIREPDADTLSRVADLYEITLDELMGRSVENTRTIQGEQVDISQLSEKQRTVLDWIMSRDSFQTVDNKDDLTKLLDEIGVIYDLIHKRGE